MEQSIGVIRKDGPVSKPYCLHFSDGRKECFSSRKQALKRERQVNFFKHQNKAESLTGEDVFAMAHLDIFAIHRLEKNDATIVFIKDEYDELCAYLIKDVGDGFEDYKLDKEYAEYDKYSSIIDDISKKYTSMGATGKKIMLSSAVVDNQLISNGHTHEVDLTNVDMSNGFISVKSSESENHTHWCDISSTGSMWISSALMTVGGLKINHTHLVVVKVGD